MSSRFRSSLTYANVMATVAVFLVLGGSAVAATQLSRNSVGTNQLKPRSVTTGRLSRSAINFLRSQVGPQGPRGKTGAKGATGARGPQGVPGLSGYSVVAASVPASTTSPKDVTARCPAGTRVLGGGVAANGDALDVFVTSSAASGAAWSGSAARAPGSGATGAWGLRVEAICASVQG